MKEEKGNKEEERLQQKYMEFQMLQQQIQQVSKYMEELDSKLEEFRSTKTNVEGMDKVDEGVKTMVSLAPGIFAHAELKENKTFVVNVGANILVEKNIPQITKMLDKQIQEIEGAHAQMNENLAALNQRAEEIVKDLQA